MQTQQITTRLERGQAIAQHSGQISRIDDNLYIVKSQSSNTVYTVNKVNDEWTCTCPQNRTLEFTLKKCMTVFKPSNAQQRERVAD